MENLITKNEELFIAIVGRVNTYLIIMGIFYLMYFLLKTEVDKFLFLLALSNVAFALLSYKHLVITNRLLTKIQRAGIALKDVTRETRKMHNQK